MKTFDDLISSAARQAMHDDRRIRRLISRIVPADALAHVQFCRIDGMVLRLTVDNASWLSRLRFSESQIIGELATKGIEANTISWHVASEKLTTPKRSSKRKIQTGAAHHSAAIVRATAEALEEDNPLKRALLKTAQHLKHRIN